jgi:hypothetical protein
MIKLGRRVWLGLAVALMVVGVANIGLTVSELTSRVVVHETVVFEQGRVVLGPYHLEADDYTVWIEDYFPGFDDGEMFEVVRVRDDGMRDHAAIWSRYDTKTIDPEDDWVFEIEVNGDTGDDTIDVFIARKSHYRTSVMFGLGVVSIILGLIVVVVVKAEEG